MFVFADTLLGFLYYLTSLTPSFYRRKVGNRGVNIFHKYNYCITTSLSTHCKTYCFAFQKRLFCTVKAAVLRRKTAAFAMPNRN